MTQSRHFLKTSGFSLLMAALLVCVAVTQTAARGGANSAAAAFSPVAADAAPPVDTVTSVTFRSVNTCGTGSQWTFKINGVVAGSTTNASTTCDCNAANGAQVDTVFTITNPSVLANFPSLNSPYCSTFSFNHVNGSWGNQLHNARETVQVTRSLSGIETTCVFDATGQNCSQPVSNYCGAFESGERTSVLTDTDSDGVPNCTDTDADNDGIANTSDNCPYASNATQLDTDHNGRGDACDAFDRDADGVWNINDNCPDTPNADQADTDNNGTGNACQALLAAVPWAGLESKPHSVYSGGSLVLQASATLGGRGDKVTLASGSWDPGDGSPAIPVNVSDSRVLEATHTYTGAAGTPYTAIITVVDGSGNSYTDTFKVQIQSNSLDTRVNMAIDRALWFNHKNVKLEGSGAATRAYCTDNNNVACTSGMMQAFEVNGHRETGDPTKDPYVDDVARGLRYLQTHIRRLTISGQPGGNPDTNGNGYGLETDGGSVVYVGGEIVDAFVATGTPNATATQGPEAGRTYKAIVTDLMDAYSFGQNENGQGGWIYDWNDQGGFDSSSSGWWGVGVLAGEVWGIAQPQWVKDLNYNAGLPQVQTMDGTNLGNDGVCGYRNQGWINSPYADTGACLLMLDADGKGRTDVRYAAAERYVRRTFPNDAHSNIYAMYGVTKGLRLAKDSTGQISPIVLLGGDKDWYADPTDGFATGLVNSQSANGQLAPYGGEVSGTFANSWGILILSPALFEQGPTAVCSVDATSICQAGAAGGCNTTGTNPYATVHFDGSQSTAGDNPIAVNGYSWNFDDGGSTTDANGVTASTSYTTTGTKNATLTVSDTKGNNSSVTCPVAVTSTALPPIVSAGGPYSICLGDPVILTGAGSVGRGSNIVSYEWDFKGAINFAAIDAVGLTTEQTTYFTSLGVGTYDLGLRIKDDNQPVNTEIAFSTVTMRDCTPPVITVPANISAITTGSSFVVVYNVSATDNVDSSVTVACSSSPTAGLGSGSSFPLGTTTLTCNAIDRAGNRAAPKSFTVTVSNNTPPTITVPPNMLLEATSPSGAVANFTATANDTQDGVLTPVCTPVSGSAFGIDATTSRTTTVNCSVTDSGGLSASGNFTVTVKDTTPPVITTPPNTTIHATSAAGAMFAFSASATDIVDVTDSVSCSSPFSGSVLPMGPTTVNCTSFDQHNNRSNKSFTVTVTNAAPVAKDDGVTTHGAVTINVLSNDSDADGDTLTVSNTSGAQRGSVTVNANQTITYTPFLNQPNTGDSFSYTIVDGRGGAATAVVNITVTNAVPVANNDSVTLAHSQTSITIPVLDNDTDADGDTLVVTSFGGGTGGTLLLNLNGTITYTANAGFFGPTATFNYSVKDQRGGFSNSAIVTINFTNAKPTDTPYSVTTHGSPVTVNVLANAADADGDTVTLKGACGIDPGKPQHGFCQVNQAAGTVTYTPFGNWFGPTDTFGYSIDDGHGGTVFNVAKVTVTYVNAVPVVVPHAFTTQANTPITLRENDVLVGDTDADGDHLFVPEGATISHGTLGPLPNNEQDGGVFTPDLNFVGDAIITFVVDDGHGGQVHDTAVIHVVPAPSVTTINCPASVVYNGSAQTVCTAHVTGNGGLDQNVAVTYTSNTDVGTASANATFTGDAAHVTSSASTTFEIKKVSSTTVVTCPASLVYTGSALTPCTAHVTGAGGLDADVTSVSHSANTNVGTAAATATYAGDDNHLSSTGSSTFEITKAGSVTVVTCPTSLIYTGSALTPCTAHVTGTGGLDADVTPVTHSANTNVGTAGATATYGGDANHSTSTGNATFAITQAATSTAINAPTITVAANGTVTVTVTSGSGTVLGNVSLTVDGGAAVTQALTGGSSAFTVTSPNAGDHPLAASYAAQGNFAASTATGNLKVNPSPTATTLTTSATPQLAGTAVTFTATVVATTPGSGTPNGTVTFYEGATALGTPSTLNAAGVATFSTTTLSNGPHTITAVYNGVNNYTTSSSNTVSKLIYGLATGGGTFVIGDNNATMGNAVNFWGSQWEKTNSLTGGASNASFKGFAITPALPTVGATFTSAPGNSAPPPAGVPQYIGIIVTSKVTKSGSNITGMIVKLVVVRVDAGYSSDPGHAGTGTIIAFIQ